MMSDDHDAGHAGRVAGVRGIPRLQLQQPELPDRAILPEPCGNMEKVHAIERELFFLSVYFYKQLENLTILYI
jgi:hypothetical protein